MLLKPPTVYGWEYHPSSNGVVPTDLVKNSLAQLRRQLGRFRVPSKGEAFQAWSDGQLQVITDRPSFRHRLRVFPVFGDENVLLTNVLTQIKPRRVLDIGTGSGILAIAAARAGAFAEATDINSRALAFARMNARLNEVDDRIEFRLGSVFPPRSSTFDVIVSNPPFVPNPLRGRLHVAGDGGSLGTKVILPILRDVRRFLSPDGCLIMMAMSLQRRGVPYVVELAERTLPSEFKLDVHLVYPDPLPLIDYSKLYAPYTGGSTWAEQLSSRGFEELAYCLVVAQRKNRAISAMPTPEPTTSMSGNWKARLRRYRCWLSTAHN